MLLIDAFNVIRAQWVLPPHRRGMDVRGLIRLVGRSRFAGRRLRVVVDGNPGPEWARHGVFDTLTGMAWTRVGRAEVVFSGRGREADDIIEEILAREHGFAVTVVSSDRRLVRAAGLAGADQIGNGSFLRLLNEDLDRADAESVPAFAAEVPLDKYAIAHWMAEFGFDPGSITEPAAEPKADPEPKPAPVPPKKKRTKKDAAPGPFGSTLGDSLPDRPAPPHKPAPDPAEPLDPLLRDAFREWAGTFNLEDLDMRKWIDGVEPL